LIKEIRYIASLQLRLGVPIFKGKPKAIFLQPVADKVKAKSSA